MTLADILKKVFGSKLDEEVNFDNRDDDKDKETSEGSPESKNESADNENIDSKESIDNEDVKDKETSETKEADSKKENESKESEETTMGIFEDGWYDTTSGKIDFSKIKNDEVLAAVKTLNDKYVESQNQRLISDSINAELKNYSLAVSEDTLRKVLDMSGIKIDEDGKVTGVKEAFESLKTSEPSFFKNKETESNPLNEGFNPVDKATVDNINSFSQAFALMEES